MQDVPIHPKKRFDIPFIVSNILFLVILLTLFIIVVARYKQSIETVTLRDNRFLTVEWNLLQRLKAETDYKLRQKDSEIQGLKRQYEQYAKEDSPPVKLLQIQEQLEKAREERKALLARRNLELVQPVESLEESIPSDPGSIEIIREHILELEQGLKFYNSLLYSGNTPQPVQKNAVESNLKKAELEAMLEQEISALEATASPGVREIKTQSLLRAIINSPYVRSEYPGLLETYDSHFETYGNRMKLLGRKEALEDLLNKIAEKPD